jgi:DNA-binding NarL/FixJ family response regulator
LSAAVTIRVRRFNIEWNMRTEAGPVAGLREVGPDEAADSCPPRDEGLRAAIEARRRQPQLGVLVLSQYGETAYANELIGENTGGIGYLLKERIGDVRAFLDALQRVADGGTVLDRQVVTQLLATRDGGSDTLGSLTGREREVLELMAEGRSNTAIAEALFVTSGAVEKHITNIFSKLDLPACDDDHRRVLAVLAYLRLAR